MSAMGRWQLVELGKVCRLPERQVRPSEFSKYDYYVGLEHIEGDTGRIIEYQKLSKSNLKSSKFPFDDSCVLYGKLRPYLNKVALPTVKGVCSTDILPLKPVLGLVCKEFLYYFLRSPSFVKIATEKSTGANLPRISPDVLLSIPIAVPPINAQKKIAETLVRTDQLWRKREQANQLTGKVIRSVFLKIFGNPVKNPKHFRTQKLPSVAKLERGKFQFRPRTEPRFYGGKYPFIQIGDIPRDRIYITSYTQTLNEKGLAISKMFPRGTIVIAIAATIGEVGILAFDSCFPDSLVGITPDQSRVNPEYLYLFLTFMKTQLTQLAPLTAQRNINLRILSEVDVPIPPMEQQQKFSEVVQATDGIRRRQESSTSEINELFLSLMQKAFRGRELVTTEIAS